jgi:dipeptidyl aminopeptidase/acylaminoacyl peptidase
MKMPLALCVLALAAWTPSAVAGTRSAMPGIVVSADRAPALSGEVYRIDRDGRRTDLSRSPFQDTQPLISPDGRLVAFVSDRTGQTAVYVVGADGRGLRRISTALAQPRLLGWSPDGRDILTAVGLNPTTQLSIVGLDHPQRAIVGRSDPCGAIQAGWAPDGRAIAFVGCTNGSGSVRVVTPSGAPLFHIPSATRRTFFFWSPAGGLFDGSGRPLARFVGDALAWSSTGDRVASIAGGRLEVRSAAGRESFHAQLFPESEIHAIKKAVGSYDPELLWMGPDRVAVANVRLSDQIVGPIEASPDAAVSGGVDIATGKR